MERPRRVAVAVVAAFVVAEAAVLLLRPRDGVIAPAPVDPGSYFTNGQIDRARDYRHGQLALFGAGLAIEAVALVWLVRRPPARLRGPFRRPVLVAAGAGAALSVGLTVVQLPVSAVSHQRAVDVGLSTQDWGPWLGDVAKSTGIGAVFAGVGAGVAVALMRRFPRGWWAPGSVLVVGFAAATLYLGPVVLDPIFNKFTDLPAGRTRDDVLALAREAGVDVGHVYEVDASRRTTASNAYVAGLGRTKRVVLYDNLLKDFSRDEVRLVVAHELGHVHYRDVPRGLVYVLLVAPAGLFAAAALTRRLAPAEPRPGPAVLPALALSLAVVSFGVTVIANQLSRRIEARADSYSLRLTDAPKPFIGFEKGIALRNLADPDPPGWLVFLLGTHPPTVDRIGIAKAFEAGAR
ncbi:MAG TPA: M48 family metalloprotease [Solirubrobacteraceae bacterium]